MASDPKIIRNIATVQYDYQPEPGVTKEGTTESSIASVSVYNPSVYTKKVSCAQATGPDNIVKFNLIGVNNGNIDLNSIQFKDIMDSRMSLITSSVQAFVNGATAPYTLTTNPNLIISVTAPTGGGIIKPKDEVLVSLAASVTSNLSITSSALTNSLYTGYVYPDPTSSTPVVVPPTITPIGGTVTIDVKYAKLTVSKQVQSVLNHLPSGKSITSVTCGSEIAYVISLTNTGNVTAFNVSGSDLLPHELSVSIPDGISIPASSYTLNNNYFEFYGLTVPAAYTVAGGNIIAGTAVINITGIINCSK